MNCLPAAVCSVVVMPASAVPVDAAVLTGLPSGVPVAGLMVLPVVSVPAVPDRDSPASAVPADVAVLTDLPSGVPVAERLAVHFPAGCTASGCYRKSDMLVHFPYWRIRIHYIPCIIPPRILSSELHPLSILSLLAPCTAPHADKYVCEA